MGGGGISLIDSTFLCLQLTFGTLLLLLLLPVFGIVTEVDLLVLAHHKPVHVVSRLREGGTGDLELIFKGGQPEQFE